MGVRSNPHCQDVVFRTRSNLLRSWCARFYLSCDLRYQADTLPISPGPSTLPTDPISFAPLTILVPRSSISAPKPSTFLSSSFKSSLSFSARPGLKSYPRPHVDVSGLSSTLVISP